MEKLEFLILHCSDTPENFNIQPHHIDKWHLIDRGWSQVGYRRLIMRDGSIFDWTKDNGDQWVQDNEITNGAFGYNKNSQHWCIGGGAGAKQKDQFSKHFTDKQFDTLNKSLKEFIAIHPKIRIIGHNQVSIKSCPGFWVPDLLRLIGIDEKNIIDYKLI